uniref:DNA-binding response regulator n=1 Tax=Thermosporothrix sp. COM3 TaxID=2490863 RepID=A0A455SIE3_9CHLR|nr:DNA-binding response regulator [Thermosporothrix sp. COM3]
MQMNIVIAEPRDVLREGLRAILLEDNRVSNVHGVTNEKELLSYLLNHRPDLVIVNQSLISEITNLPTKRFAILTDEPDMALLKAAYEHGAKGYLSPNVSSELLRATLSQESNTFVIEPALVHWMIEHFFYHSNHFAVQEELLTPREKEIVHLLREGYDRPSIARQLCIAETTLKTHIQNITKKRDKAAPTTPRILRREEMRVRAR